ncbi:hypothetical protein MPER_07493 [Moniliophthora perniciosa FA553]|nr:hypothetical protein MPER_07493 [Moniliophthora perniciosa FA553]
MIGELEIVVLPDDSHRFIPGQKTVYLANANEVFLPWKYLLWTDITTQIVAIVRGTATAII